MKKAPIIYSVLPRLWRNLQAQPEPNGTLRQNGSGKLADWDEASLDYVRSLGCDYIWFVGLIEHATKESYEGIPAAPEAIVKGVAGSPYAIKDYYDIAPELATQVERRMQEFESLVERVHSKGLKLMMDFVPNHVARSYHSDAAPKGISDLGAGDDKSLAFSVQNNFYYLKEQRLELPNQSERQSYEESPARATGNDCFNPSPSANDWYETIKLNYGIDYQGGGNTHFEPIPSTWHKMLQILGFWASKGVDGFRCDMAEMVPPAFWSWALTQLKSKYPLTFLAEVYQPSRYTEYLEAGFDYLYDKVGVYDQLKAIVRGEASACTFDPVRDAVNGRQREMCYFLENHDEQRFASPFFAGNKRALIPALATMALSSEGAYLHYFAGELGEEGMDKEGFSGQDGRTTIFDFWSLASLRRLGAKLDGKGLSDEERALLTYHQHILLLLSNHPIIQGGKYHGLNYLQGSEYDGHRLLSFVRYNSEGIVLVVANFAHEGRRAPIHFTAELLKLVGIEPNNALQTKDLRRGTQYISTLSTFASFDLELEALDAQIIEFRPIP